MAKRYRVTQYREANKLGRAFGDVIFGRQDYSREKGASKDFRWLWRAKLCAWANRGTSSGLGLFTLTTEIEEI